jgi:NADH-quinone oxidoreductase subunit L
MQALIPYIVLLPLLGFVVNGLLGKRLPKSVVGIIGSGTVLFSFLSTICLFVGLNNGVAAQFTYTAFNWFSIGDWTFSFSFLVDQLSVWMMLVVTGIGFLIHVYSIGYMHDDEGFYKFFAYLNLFIFSMLLLVMGSNYLVLFAGWEGVGLCSYLLIGFWFRNAEYGKAARKAFVMNRIGDLALLLGLFLILLHFGTLEFTGVKEILDTWVGNAEVNVTLLTAITMLLFIGAVGKSAQIPLFTWLPDAMAGPTPVSALIHAATMVTAGIYLVVRSNFMYALTPFTLQVIAVIGLSTSIFAALIALRQNDIKKVLAYSTVSQLGLMFLALGLGAYTTAMFHLTTHAFFKALLFLGAGSVIHAMSGEQDIRKMGGLKSKLPITFWTFLLGTLAIIGFPLTAGFFSKDEILAAAYMSSPLLWGLTVASAVLTGIYMLRMFFLTFYGGFRGTAEQQNHLHESPISMTLPLIILAVLSVAGGVLNIPALLSENGQWLNNWLAPVNIVDGHAEHLPHSTEWLLIGITTVLVFIIIAVTYSLFVIKQAVPVADEQQEGFTKLSANKFYIDEIYDAIIVRPLEWISSFLHRFVERWVIDGAVNGSARVVSGVSNTLKWLQNGNVEFYLMAMVIGILIVLAFNTIF